MVSTPEFWVAVSFLAFVGMLVYLNVPGQIASALDGRAEKIRSELEQAKRLREEAQALLAEYQRKRRDAEQEAQSIIAAAEREATRLSADTRQALQEMMARRMQMAEQKIAQAENIAVQEVRAAAAEIAVDAAEALIKKTLTGESQGKLIADGIKDVGKLVN